MHWETTDWAAMQFLRSAISESIRRIRFHQYLLLALRVATLLVFAVALADPRLSGRGEAPQAEGPAHHILVFDGSYSMDHASGNTTCFERVKRYAERLIQNGPDGDGYSIILMGSPAKLVIGPPSFDRSAIMHQVRNLGMEDGGGDLEQAISLVEEVIDASRQAFRDAVRRQVTFLTDLQTRTWQAVTSSTCRGQLTELAKDSSIEVVSFPRNTTGNLTITSITPVEGFPAVRSPVILEIGVANFGDEAETANVDLLADGQVVASDTVEIEPRRTKSIAFTHHFSSAKDHSIEARLSDDGLNHDNRRYLSLPIGDEIHVACVADSDAETRYLEPSLQAFASEQSRLKFTTTDPLRLQELTSAGPDCVLLVDVASFTASDARILARLLSDGCGLIFMLGKRIDSQNYNDVLGTGPRALLPVEIKSLQNGGPFSFDPRNFEHPIVRPFAEFPRAGLLNVATWRYFQLDASEAKDATTALWFNNRDPAIIEGWSHGSRVTVVATAPYDTPEPGSPDQELWTTWPLSPSFPPIMLRLVERAVLSRVERRNVRLGQPIESTVPSGPYRTVFVKPTSRPESAIQIVPDPATREWKLLTARQAGFYQVDYEGLEKTEVYAVNLDTDESQLDMFPAADLPASIVVHRPGAATEANRVRAAAGERRLFRIALITVIGLLFCESLVALHAGKGR
jgi:hypothetical protein